MCQLHVSLDQFTLGALRSSVSAFVSCCADLQHAYMMPKARTPVSMGQQAVSVTINAEYALYARAAKWPYVNR